MNIFCKFSVIIFLSFLLPILNLGCSNSNQNIVYFNSVNINATTNYNDFSKKGPSLNKLWNGGKSYSDGNYIVMISTTNIDNGEPNDFLSLILASQNTSDIDNFGFLNSDFVNTVTSFQLSIDTETNNSRKISFVIYMEQDIEVPDHLDENGQKYANPIRMSPFGKWTNFDMTQKDVGTEYNDEWRRNHKEGDYCRNDSDAKNYRNTVEKFSIVFGEEKFNQSKTTGVFGWCEGEPVSGSLTDYSLSSFYSYLHNNWTFFNK